MISASKIAKLTASDLDTAALLNGFLNVLLEVMQQEQRRFVRLLCMRLKHCGEKAKQPAKSPYSEAHSTIATVFGLS